MTNKQKILIVLSSLIALFLISKTINYWRADFYFAESKKSENTGQLNEAEKQITQAIKLNPSEPNFYSQKSVIEAKAVAGLSKKDSSVENLGKLIKSAIKNSQKSLEISPYHTIFYKNQAKVYYYLAFYDINYLKEALKTLSAVSKIAPTDPKIYYNIGLIYQTLNDDEQAKKYFKKTVDLKPNYQKARKSLEEVTNL